MIQVDTQAIIITGMHRSGTSLVAKSFHGAHHDLGQELKGASEWNRDGYFEDVQITRFHDALLAANGTHWMDARRLARGQLVVSSELAARAVALVAQKSDTAGVWGWKDPRTTLFLRFWKDLLPTARFVFVYRTPEEMVWSLWRRHTPKGGWQKRLGRARRFVALWTHYNAELVRFATAFRRDVLLIKIPADARPSAQTRIQRVLHDRWGLQCAAVDISRHYQGGYMHRDVPLWLSTICRLNPAANRVLARLDGLREAGVLDPDLAANAAIP